MIPSTQRASDPGDCGCRVDPGSGGGCPVGPGPKAAVLAQITPAQGGRWSAVLQRQGSLGTFATLAAAMAAAYGAMAHG